MSTEAISRTVRQQQLNLISSVLDECKELPKGAAVAVLRANWPSRARSFFENRFDLLMSLSAEELAHVLGYTDPTGDQAVRNVMKEATA